MKPENTKRNTAPRRRTNDDGCSPFNLRSLKQAIEAIDGSKDNSINLSSLSVALSAASREMKQREKSQRRRETRKRRKKNKKDNKKLVIGTKPETDAELRRWFSNFDKSFKLSLPRKLNNHKPSKEAQICELNTDFSMNHCSESFRY